jgi:lysophospholipase L1-like esterase
MIYSFGDSFTAGLGVDREYETSQLGGHPDWNTMTDEQKGIQRKKVERFRHENSYTAHFARRVGIGYSNNGLSGCSNIHILNSIFESGDDFKQGDIVFVGFTSSLRNPISFFPRKFSESGWKLAPNLSVLKGFVDLKISTPIMKYYSEESMSFFQDYSKFYLTEMFDEQYYEIVNYNIIVFLQKYLEYKKVNYIMFDAFDYMVNKNYEHINQKYYWNFNNETIYSYITSFNDEGLLEMEGYNLHNQAPRHPSTAGHKLFAEELYKFYKKVYDG